MDIKVVNVRCSDVEAGKTWRRSGWRLDECAKRNLCIVLGVCFGFNFGRYVRLLVPDIFRMNELLRNLSRSLYIQKIKWMADVGEGAGEIIYDGITK